MQPCRIPCVARSSAAHLFSWSPYCRSLRYLTAIIVITAVGGSIDLGVHAWWFKRAYLPLWDGLNSAKTPEPSQLAHHRVDLRRTDGLTETERAHTLTPSHPTTPAKLHCVSQGCLYLAYQAINLSRPFLRGSVTCLLLTWNLLRMLKERLVTSIIKLLLVLQVPRPFAYPRRKGSIMP